MGTKIAAASQTSFLQMMKTSRCFGSTWNVHCRLMALDRDWTAHIQGGQEMMRWNNSWKSVMHLLTAPSPLEGGLLMSLYCH